MAMDYFRLYPGELLTDPDFCALSLTQQGVALRLWCLSWLHGPLPADLAALRRLLPAEATPDDLEPVIHALWRTANGRISSRRLEAERKEASAAYTARVRGARGAMKSRKLKQEKAVPADAQHSAQHALSTSSSARSAHAGGKAGRKVGRKVVGSSGEGSGEGGVTPAVQIALAANAGLRANPHVTGCFNELLPQQAELYVADWIQAGIPLPLLCETIQAVAARFKPGPGKPQPSSFAYFARPVQEAHARAVGQAALENAKPAVAAPPTPPRLRNLA